MATRETQAGALVITTHDARTRETQAGAQVIASWPTKLHETQAGVQVIVTVGSEAPPTIRRRPFGQVI